MSKVLAIADIHMGEYRYPVRFYINDALAQIVVRAEELKPDLILFAGDAFRTRVPSALDLSDMGMWFADLAKIAPVIMIPGNHDIIGSRGVTTLDVFSHFYNVVLVRQPEVLTIGHYQIACVPWLPQKAKSSSGLESEKTDGAVRAVVDLLKAQLEPDHTHILLAHCTAFGAEYKEGADVILGNDVLWTNDMFEGFDVCVLGHIHSPQQINENTFYVGSPCPVSFSEITDKTIFSWENGQGWPQVTLNTPMFYQINASEAQQYVDNGWLKNSFVQIKKGHDEPDPPIPECLWHEILTLPPERELRVRLGDVANLTPQQALIAWMEQEGLQENVWAVMELVDQLKGGNDA